MPKQGVMSFRITRGRRIALDHGRYALSTPAVEADGHSLTDGEVIDFALEWMLVTLPERLTRKQVQRLLPHIVRSLDAGAAATDAEVTVVGQEALAARVRDTHGSTTRTRLEVTDDEPDGPCTACEDAGIPCTHGLMPF